MLWTGGGQARELAEVLGGDTAHQAGANIAAACIEARATLLVARNRVSIDLCNTAVPHGFTPATTSSIVAAVGSGPHSLLAAALADSLSRKLNVPASAVYGHSQAGERAQAEEVLSDIIARLPELDAQAVEAPSPSAMVSALPDGTLLIVGAPGGSWFQRRFFGPGARIIARAPSGTIVVNHSRTRIYQVMQEAVAVGPHMRAADARQLYGPGHVMIAEDGALLGVVPADTLENARPDRELCEIMDRAVFLSANEETDQAAGLIEQFGGGPVPVVDSRGRLVGSVSSSDILAGRLL